MDGGTAALIPGIPTEPRPRFWSLTGPSGTAASPTAIVDYCYTQQETPRVAVEVLLGHGCCHIIGESSVMIPIGFVAPLVRRIAGEEIFTNLNIFPQDVHLAENQDKGFRCGDNGIFKGMPVTEEQRELARIAHDIFAEYPTDGKYILDGDRLIICQSDAEEKVMRSMHPLAEVNPLGLWTGGTDVDIGATNRKLGSDMAMPSYSR